jgi:hypothetical protein
MHFAILVANGDVFSWAERMTTETITGLIVFGGGAVVIEDPALLSVRIITAWHPD